MHVANKRTGHKQNDVYDDASVRELAKVLNMVVAIVAVVVFSWLSQRFRRQLTVLFGDLFSTLMVATFFAFLSDSVTPDTAKRFYGVVGLGCGVGGVLDTTMVRGLISRVQSAGWLWICVVIPQTRGTTEHETVAAPPEA